MVNPARTALLVIYVTVGFRIGYPEVSAFEGTDLAVVLRTADIKTLVLFGIATSGVVLSTVRRASDLDYELVVLDDLCDDRDEEVHGVLIRKVFPSQARVVSSGAFISEITAS